MFYVLIFSIMAVVLVVGGLSTMARRRRNLEFEEAHMGAPGTHTDAARKKRNAERAQSRKARRKRH